MLLHFRLEGWLWFSAREYLRPVNAAVTLSPFLAIDRVRLSGDNRARIQSARAGSAAEFLEIETMHY
jgi:hypothetical protein